MRTIIITILIMVFWQMLFAQKTEVFFGESNRMDWSAGIIEMYDNGYYISGGFEGSDDYIYGWNIKSDKNLEILYDKVFEHSLGDIGISNSITDSEGNIYICGYISYTDQWPFISKMGPCGEYQWCKILNYEDEFNNGWSNDIILNNNNEIVLLTTLVSDDQIDMTHLIGLSNNGDVLWKKPYASRNDHSWIRQPIGSSIISHNDVYYISGKCYWPYPDDTTHWFLRPLFIGIDSLLKKNGYCPSML
ncbi:MAG: hypothetical protein R2764_02325 [Bacteroidales bacterium]